MQSEANAWFYKPPTNVTENKGPVSKSFYKLERERLLPAKKLVAKKPEKSTRWVPLLLFGSVVMTWVLYILIFSEEHQQSPLPIFLMTFFLLIVAAIQVPISISRQYRQDRKSSGYINDGKKKIT